nr:immunoglobulin light chain junction region [Macaca mulatta]MOX86627.1 immunoglobulin light chain junction region [Macaca mulatta]MOX87125.1 immunoglobulin light chain junction region [Macaca mulatta]MOX87229.1 immunoglobulin light chain junction region [Macaca mulatta]MOX90035.1 immunoglobulin light chain junction region [Macaca mulatta]
CLQYHSDPFTF